MVLGPGDQLTVAAPEIEELDRRQLKVQADGTVSVPLVGPMKVSGLTPRQFAADLTQALRSQFRDPRITFSQIDVRSKPVTVLGAVNNPGVVQADGRKRLIEILSLAGGLRSDAGPTLTLARKTTQANPFPADLRTNTSGNYVTASVPVHGLLEGTNPADNIVVVPGDIITVPKGKLVYVLGDVRRSGGFVIGETNDVSVLKALSLAEGLKETANPSHARILKHDASGQRTEEEIDLKKLLSGKGQDINLGPDDILFVPSSLGKKVTARSLDAMVQMGTGIAIFH
jgi:polysaccharide export outer membrane protein